MKLRLLLIAFGIANSIFGQIEPESIDKNGANLSLKGFNNRKELGYYFNDDYFKYSEIKYEKPEQTNQFEKDSRLLKYDKEGITTFIVDYRHNIVQISQDGSYIVQKLKDGYYIKDNAGKVIPLMEEDGSRSKVNLNLIRNGEKKIYDAYWVLAKSSQTGKYIRDADGRLFDSKTGIAMNLYTANGDDQPFFLNDKFCLSRDTLNGKKYLSVIDVDNGVQAHPLWGNFKFFSYNEKMIVTSIEVVNSATGANILANTIDGFSDDLLYGFKGSSIYSLATRELFYDFGAHHNIISIVGEKVTTNFQNIENHFFNFERIKVYSLYKEQINNEISAVPFKDEFETLEAYNIRLSKEKNRIFSKYENINAERKKELIKQIQDSYSQIQLKIDQIGPYIAEREEFPITINGNILSIKIPLEEAKTFKPNYANAKVTASKQLNITGSEYETFNIKIAHPITGSIYNFGEQRDPLYLDNTIDKTAETGVPVLSISAKLIEPSGNNLIDGNEKAEIELTLNNSGNGIAKDVRINMSAKNSIGLKFDQAQKLSGIAPGQKQIVKLQIEADRNLKNGTADFTITVTEWKGFNPAPINLSVNTQEFKKPKLVYIESGIKELMGNGNNIIENNEIIELSALIQNIGQGPSEKTDVFFKINDSNIISTTPKKLSQQIGDIKPGESLALTFAFTVNNEYSGSDQLPIEISLLEKFQEYGGTFPLNLEMKKVSMTAQNIKVEGEYNKDVAIKEVSLTSDVDKNIPDSNNKNSKRYALIIGNEHYSTFQTGLKTESDVAFASNDAITFAKYAEKTLGVPSDQITLLVDANSTAMKRELNRITSLAQYSNGEAELIIYYAGHGFPDETTKEGYIIPVDVTGTDITSGIKLADMYKQLAGANPKRVTIFLDACFSGGGRDAGLLAARGIKVTPKSEPIEGNLVIFSACSAEQTSLPYSEKTHGLFTYFLLKKFQESKGNISYQDLGAYIRQEVPLKSVLVNGKDQNPEVLFSPSIENQWGSWMVK